MAIVNTLRLGDGVGLVWPARVENIDIRLDNAEGQIGVTHPVLKVLALQTPGFVCQHHGK